MFPKSQGSEAKAGQSLEFSCTEHNQQNYLNIFCGGNLESPLEEDRKKALLDIQEEVLLSRLREQSLEYLGASILTNDALINQIQPEEKIEDDLDIDIPGMPNFEYGPQRNVNLQKAEETFGGPIARFGNA